MVKISPILMGLCLAVTGASLVPAQDSPTTESMPKVLQVSREFIKPGKAGLLHDKTEAAFVAAMGHARLKGHYVALNSLSGKSRALFLTGYPSFEAWEADNKTIDKSASLTAELDHALVNDGELLEGFDQAIATYDDELSYRARPDLSHARYIEVTMFHVRPGHRKEFHELVKLVKEGHDKGGTSAHWATYEVAYGAEDGTYIVLSADKSMSEIDTAFGESKKWIEGLGGQEALDKLDKLFGEAVDLSRNELFAINPRQSYADDAWIKADPDFWKPKSAEASAKPAGKSASTVASAKPAAH